MPRSWKTPSALTEEICVPCRDYVVPNALLGQPLPRQNRYILQASGKLEDMHEGDCPLCRLLSTAIVQPAGALSRHQPHLRILPGHAMSGLKKWRNPLPDQGVAFAIFSGSPERMLGSEDRYFALLNGVVAPVPKPHTPTRLFTAHIVHSMLGREEYLRMKGWLEHCETSHERVCGLRNPPKLPSGFTCIDVTTRKITCIKQGERYFTLSWVWGVPPAEIVKVHQDQAVFVGPLGNGPIENAIEVVKKLGEQYLWVDQYCINQDDTASTREMIQKMDSIYEGAFATIVAAPRINSSNCLPGVKRARNIQQPALQIGGLLLASTLPHLSKVLSNTKWITRGWTYQEALLSRRALYFTDQQVYFVCRGMTCCESIARDMSLDEFSLERCNLRTDVLSLQKEDARTRLSTGLWEFFENLHNYKSRDLTDPDDSINAFQGLLSRSPYKNIWGIPVAYRQSENTSYIPNPRSLAMAFMRGLWWENPYENSATTSRRHEIHPYLCRLPKFPSWSWAGWAGGPNRPHEYIKTHNPASDQGCNAINKSTFSTEILLDIAVGAHQRLEGPTSLVDWWLEARASAQAPEVTHLLHVQATVCEVRIRWHGSVFYICSCSSTEECLGWRYHNDHNDKHVIRFFENFQPGTPEYETLSDGYWSAVLLFELDVLESGWMASWIFDFPATDSEPAEVKGVAILHTSSISGFRQYEKRFTIK